MPLYLKIYQHALEIALTAVFPSILVLLAVGLTASIIQTIFQIEDTTFSLLPKTLAMVFLVFSGGIGAFYIFQNLCIDFIVHAPILVRQAWY